MDAKIILLSSIAVKIWRFLLILALYLLLAGNSMSHPYSDYGSWVDANFSSLEISSGQADAGFDLESDGLKNFLEFALHRNPHLSDAANLTPASVGTDGHLLLSFDSIAVPSGISYIVQVSSDLVNWKSGSTQVELTSSSLLEPNRLQVTYRDKMADGASNKRFMRVKVVSEDTDDDGDGVWDWLEYKYYGGLDWNGSGSGGAGQDSDGDGRGDIQEQIDGTDPNDAGSFLLPEYGHQKVIKLYTRKIAQHQEAASQGGLHWVDDPDYGFILNYWPSSDIFTNVKTLADVGDYHRFKSEYYLALEEDNEELSARSTRSSARTTASSSRPVEWAIIKHSNTSEVTVEKISIDLFSSSTTYSVENVDGSDDGGEDADNSTILGAMSPTCPTIYMFSGNDKDVVELAAPELVNQSYEWKLKNTSGAQGEFQNEGSTSWGPTGSTFKVKFRAGKSGSPNVQGHTRQQAPGENVIQVKMNGSVLFEKPIEVLEIKPRSSWGAASPNLAGMGGMAEFKRVTFHHSKDQRDGPTDIKRIQTMHMRSKLLRGKGFDDIGYHFVMTHNGEVYEGRSSEGLGLSGGPYTKGSHVLDNNTEAGVGICIMGQYQPGISEASEAFPDTRQEAAEKAITAICRRYNIPFDKISYHSAMALAASESTECPGQIVRDKANEIISDVKINLE